VFPGTSTPPVLAPLRPQSWYIYASHSAVIFLALALGSAYDDERSLESLAEQETCMGRMARLLRGMPELLILLFLTDEAATDHGQGNSS